MLLQLTALLLVAPLSPVAPHRGVRPALVKVVGAVLLPGLGAASSTIGFGTIIAFGALLFAQQGWSPIWLAFSAFAVSLVAARAIFGQMPDKFGGARAALVCVMIEAAGLVI